MLALTTLPPNTGDFSNTAYFIPGSFTSMPKSFFPVTMLALSTWGTRVPTMRKSLGSLSVSLAGSGMSMCAACSASSPYVALLPLAGWRTTPRSVTRLPGDTIQMSAAAAISIARADAPMRRIGS